MFSQLFQKEHAIRRYREAPLARSRLDYLTHCAGRGYSRATLLQIAHWQLVVVRCLDLQAAGAVGLPAIEAAADRWASRKPRHGCTRNAPATRKAFVTHAIRWLRFADRLDIPPVIRHPHADKLALYADSMRRDRLLAEETVRRRCGRADEFLARHCPREDSLRTLAPADLDRAFARKTAEDGCSRVTLRAYQYDLRDFLRHAAKRGWCDAGLADAIRPAPAYRLDSLPSGPAWKDVKRLLAEMPDDGPAAVRARAVLLLLAVYGARSGEVRRLRLDDLDWNRETIRFRRSKQPRQDLFPLARAVGDAIIRYLREVRPQGTEHREVLLTLRAPTRPLSPGAVYAIASQHLRALAVPLRHYGPHALRHACAVRLLQQGFRIKEIGDCLGHRDPAATAVYAKVDLAGLREVADFDLQGVLP